MKKRLHRAFGWMFVLLCCVSSFAQTVSVARISGTVKDASGNVVAGASVSAKQIDTGMVRTVKTGSDGSYTIPSLSVGSYSVQVAMAGFSTEIRNGIVLQVDTNPTLNFNLSIGSVTQEVSVDSGAPLVDTQSVGIGSVVDNQRVNDLPLNGRHATDLITLAGAATPAPPAAFQSPRNYPTTTVSVAGGSAAGIFFVMDGGDYNDPENNLNLPAPFPDVLQEFKVETSAVPAQFGSHSSGVVNLVTKSGTNRFHGDVFEYVRNYMFNARNYFATTRDSLKRNQFGGTIGGPILRDKLFFLAGIQQTIVRSNPSQTTSYIPSQAMLAGDFSDAASPACNGGKVPALKGPLGSGTTINPATFSSVALAYERFLPATTDACGAIRYGFPSPQSDRQILGRVDYIPNQRQVVFGRYFYARNYQPYYNDPTNALATATGNVINQVHSFVLGHTYTVSPAIVNSFRGTFNRAENSRGSVPFHSPTYFGVNMTTLTPDYSALVVGSTLFQIGSSLANAAHFNSTIYQFADDINFTHGAHNIQIGGSYLRVMLNDQSNQYSNGQFTFSGANSGLALADFLFGIPSAFTQNYVQQEGQRQYIYALYAQDSWKLNQHLLLNYGLRWEPWNPMTEIHGHVEHFDTDAFSAGTKSTVYPNAPAGLSFPGDPGFSGKALTNGSMKPLAPRVGLVFDRTGQGTEVFRAGYGIFYDRPTMYENTRVSTAPPFGNQTTVTNPSFDDPWATYGSDPFNAPQSSNAVFPINGVYVTYPKTTHATTTQQWNLTFQKQPAANWVFTLSYIGNHTTHIWLSRESNAAVYVPGASTTSNVNQRRPLYLANNDQGKYYSNVYKLDDGGSASYHAALFSLEKRFSKHYSMFANYTWSHCINDGEYYEAVGVELDYQNPDNRRADRGNCAADRRNAFNLSGVVSTPDFSNRWTENIVGHWQLTAIVRAYSGDSFVPTTGGVDNALTGTNNQRPNVNGDWRLSNPGPNGWFNTSVFSPNAAGTYGNAPRGLIVGPRYTNTDMAIFRSFPVFHDQSLTFRAEAFNLLNHTQFSDPVQATNSAAFGKIQAASDPRIMQLALKYMF